MVFLHEKVKEFGDKIIESNKKIKASDSNSAKFKNLNDMNSTIIDLIKVHTSVIKSIDDIKIKLNTNKD